MKQLLIYWDRKDGDMMMFLESYLLAGKIIHQIIIIEYTTRDGDFSTDVTETSKALIILNVPSGDKDK